MDPNAIRPTRGRARGRPQLPRNAAVPSGQPVHPTPPMQTTALPPPSQSIQTPNQPGVGITARPPRQLMQPRPGFPQQRAPRPLAPRPGLSSGVEHSNPKQDPMEGVRNY